MLSERDKADIHRLHNYSDYVDGWVTLYRPPGSDLYEFYGTAFSGFMTQPALSASRFEVVRAKVRIAPGSVDENGRPVDFMERWGYGEYTSNRVYDSPDFFYLPIGDRFFFGLESE